MKKRSAVLALLFTFVLSLIPAVSLRAQTGGASQKARALIRSVGTGEKARVEGKLVDRSKFKGHVISETSDSFTLIDSKTGASQSIAYADVDEIKQPRSGLKPRTWIIIGAAAAAAIIIGKTVLYPVLCDGGAGC
jgi:hypothetical protein